MLEENLYSLETYFADVEDPRRDQGKRHPFLGILIMALSAVICHADTWPEVEEFARTKEAWFRSFLTLPHGIPSHDTFRRVFAALDPEKFQSGFQAWINQVEVVTEGDIVAIDGKTLRRSFTEKGKKGAIHLVHAWSQANHMLLGQVKVDKKSNEIIAIPQLLNLLHLKGCIVTLDAMGCQQKIVETLVEAEADYLIALKQNQGTLHTDVDHLFAHVRPGNFTEPDMDYVKQVSSGHGRVETRECWVIGDPEWLAQLRQKSRWPRLRCVVKIEAMRSTDDKRKRRETRYYISSLPVDAHHVLTVSRAHWEVENKLHWVLDVAFREDESRLRNGNGQENMALLRRWALNLIRQEKSVRGSIKKKRLKAGWSDEYLETVLFGN